MQDDGAICVMSASIDGLSAPTRVGRRGTAGAPASRKNLRPFRLRGIPSVPAWSGMLDSGTVKCRKMRAGNGGWANECRKPRPSEAWNAGSRSSRSCKPTPTSSLHNIHLATGISKPSLLRILNTLQRAGMVSRRLADGHYRISTFARAPQKRDRYDRVAEAAAPVLDRLCQKVKWPSDLFVPAGDHMERRETSRAHHPLSDSLPIT